MTKGWNQGRFGLEVLADCFLLLRAASGHPVEAVLSIGGGRDDQGWVLLEAPNPRLEVGGRVMEADLIEDTGGIGEKGGAELGNEFLLGIAL